MSPSPRPPLKQSPSTGSDSDLEWEYEYHPTETETYYVTLDVTTHSSSLARLIKKRFPNEKRKFGAVDAIIEAQENGDETEAPVALLEHHGLQLEPATERLGETQEKVQILDLHSKNPLISYQGRVYSCTWSKPLGTDVLLKVPPSILQGGLQDDTGEISPIVAWSDLRLMGKPVDLIPYKDNRAGSDNLLKDGTHITSTKSSMQKDESMQEVISPRPTHLVPTLDLSDQQSTPTHIPPIDRTETPPVPRLPESTPSNQEKSENHRVAQSQQIPNSTPSPPRSLSTSAIASATLNASSASQEVLIPTISAKPQQSDFPSNSPSLPFIQSSNINNTFSRELSPEDPVTIPLADHNSVPRRNQATFLSRLIAAKRSRGETDEVTIHAKKSYYHSSWRAQQRATKEKEASGVPLVEEAMDGNGDSGSNNERGVPVSMAQRQARGRVRRVGFTENGKKIGRPRTEAFGSGRGRGRGRGRPRISRGGRGTRNVGAGSEARRAETTTNLDVQAMEANTGASPNRVDEESLNAQEPGISAGEYPQTLVGADERWALDHSATLEGLHEE